MSAGAWLLVALLLIASGAAIWRVNELFVVYVTAGKVHLPRGRAPRRLLDEIDDVLRRNRVRDARFRVVSEGGHAALAGARGLDETCLQQLRNVLGLWPLSRIRAGRAR